MWFLNKETGLTWEVEDLELIQRLRENANYEVIQEPKQEAKNAKRSEKDDCIMNERLDLLKRLLGVELTDISKDDVFTHYLDKANSNILGYCNLDLLPDNCNSTVVDYAVYLYKNKDSVGFTQKQEGERSASYEPGIPHSIRLSLPLPKIKVGY